MENTLLEINHTNIFGEVMTLILTKDHKTFFKHDDCNHDFEEISALTKEVEVTPKMKKHLRVKTKTVKQFSYVLDEDERTVLNNFIHVAQSVSDYHKKNSTIAPRIA